MYSSLLSSFENHFFFSFRLPLCFYSLELNDYCGENDNPNIMKFEHENSRFFVENLFYLLPLTSYAIYKDLILFPNYIYIPQWWCLNWVHISWISDCIRNIYYLLLEVHFNSLITFPTELMFSVTRLPFVTSPQNQKTFSNIINSQIHPLRPNIE